MSLRTSPVLMGCCIGEDTWYMIQGGTNPVEELSMNRNLIILTLLVTDIYSVQKYVFRKLNEKYRIISMEVSHERNT